MNSTEYNFKEVFYPGIKFDPAVKDKVRASGVWPVLLQLNADMDLFLLDVLNSPNHTRYFMADRNGFAQLYVQVSGGEGGDPEVMSLHLYETSFSLGQKDIKPVLESANTRYILNRINKMLNGEETSNSLRRANMRGLPDFTRQLITAVETLVEKGGENERRQYKPTFEKFDIRNIVQHLANGDGIPTGTEQQVQLHYKNMINRDTANKAFRDLLRSYLSGPRYVLSYMGNNLISLGGIQIKWLDEALESDYQDSSPYANVKIGYDITFPFRVYNSIDDICDTIKDEVMATLHLNRMNRRAVIGRRYGTEYKSLRDGLLPYPDGSHTVVLFEDSSSLCWRNGSDKTPFYMIPDKRGLVT